jgi:hypothetical protein
LPSLDLYPASLIDKMSNDTQQIFAGDQSVFIRYFYHVEIVGVTLLAINRYTSMCLPMKHKMVLFHLHIDLLYFCVLVMVTETS